MPIVPRLSSFQGLAVWLYRFDHPPPHIHARHGDDWDRPLSPARVKRMFAPFRAAMNAAVRQQMIAISPCAAVELPRSPKIRPLAWTPAREEQFRAAVAART